MTEQIPPKAGRPSRDDIYRRLSEGVVELRDRLGGLPSPIEAGDIWRGIWFEEAHHSTALEGNTLVLKQVETLLGEGRAVGSKELREYMEVKGYADAAEWVYSQAVEPGTWTDGTAITITELREIHRMAMTPVWDVEPHPQANEKETPGVFRQHEIHPFPDGMQPPSWTDVPAEVKDWVAKVKRIRADSASFAEEVAVLHCEFERIHPFLDGNGRTGRLVLNLVLIRLGYPPVVIYKRQRNDYLKALRRADDGEYGPLGELLARSILDNLYRFVVPAVAGPSRLVPLASLATEAINSEALRVAAIRGRLQATRGNDGQWRSTRKWVNEYLKTKHQRRGRGEKA